MRRRHWTPLNPINVGGLDPEHPVPGGQLAGLLERHPLRVDLEVASEDGRLVEADGKQDAGLLLVVQPVPPDGLDLTSEPQLAAASERRLRSHCDSPAQGDDVTPAVDEPGPRGRSGRWPAHWPGAPRE